MCTIEKVSGRVLYVDIVFRGFLGLSAHHHTIPWEKLTYDTRLGGYRTDITEEQVRAAPAFYGDGYGDGEVWPDPKQEKEARDYWVSGRPGLNGRCQDVAVILIW